MDLKIFVKVGQLQHRCFHQNALQGLKGFITCSFPFVNDNGLLQEVYQRCGYLRKVLDELAIVEAKPKKDLKANTDLGGSKSTIALTL